MAIAVAVAWSCAGTGVLRADDTPVVADSHVRASPEDPPRAWRFWHERSPNQARDTERPPDLEPPPKRIPDYTGWLVGGYVAAPAIGLGVPLLITSLTDDDVFLAVSVPLAISIGALTPAAVHWAAGDLGRGLRAGLGLAGAAVGVGFIGALVGGRIGDSVHDPEKYDGDASFHYGIYGLFVGGAIGAVGWAVFDVIETMSAGGGRARASDRNRLRFALLPRSAGLAGAVAGRF